MASRTVSEASARTQRLVSVSTVEKWKRAHDTTLNTSSWLSYERVPGDREHACRLRCTVCTRFRDKIKHTRNFCLAFIDGSSNLRTSSFKDHAKTEMHRIAMHHLKKSQSTSVQEYSPVARALHRMDDITETDMKHKFDIAYMIAKEGMAYTKMAPLCELQERHKVQIGGSYRNNQACATFTDFISEELKVRLHDNLSKCKFYSIQMDGSTDSANKENELFLVVYFDPYSTDGTVRICNQYLCVRQPKSVNAAGLLETLQRALTYCKLDEHIPTKLVGLGCDGANVNMGENGMKGLMQAERPWLTVVWCLSHRLELALKDALKKTYFSDVDEFLLRLYYLYCKSPKKCSELEDVVSELKECLTTDDFPISGGVRPLRACGTRFVAHKVRAMERVLDRFGAYMNHLVALIEDPSSTMKAVDKQKLKGFVKKWKDGKILLGCAVFHDILKPSAILCKYLQADELSVVNAIESILKSRSAMNRIKSTDFEALPSVKKVLLRLKDDVSTDGKETKTYQGIEIVNTERAIVYFETKYQAYVESVLDCLRDRIKDESCDVALLSHILILLATHGWQKSDDTSFGIDSVQALAEKFMLPLEKAGCNCALLEEEWLDMVCYAKTYVNLVKDAYPVVWWKLFNCPEATKWTNILCVIELIFCLPLSNGHVERCFSQLKITKTNRRASLGENTLDHLLRIRIEGPPLKKWDASGAIQLWWEAKTRRVDACHSGSRVRKNSEKSVSESSVEDNLDLADWDTWLDSEPSDGECSDHEREPESCDSNMEED